MYYIKIHRVYSKSMFAVKEAGSLKSKLKRTGRVRRGGGGQLTKANILGGGAHVKRTGTNKGEGSSKNWEFEPTYFSNDPTPLING